MYSDLIETMIEIVEYVHMHLHDTFVIARVLSKESTNQHLTPFYLKGIVLSN